MRRSHGERIHHVGDTPPLVLVCGCWRRLHADAELERKWIIEKMFLYL
jgi:hypothetical protein